MEQIAGDMEFDMETAALKEENLKLRAELRSANRELSRRDRTITSLESNFNIKMNMFRSLAVENEKRQSFLRYMMKSSANFLILLDSDYHVAYCSDLFLREIGVKYFNEVEGKSIFDVYGGFLKGELLEAIKKGLTSAAEKNEIYRHDIVSEADESGNYKLYRITNTPMFDNKLNGIIIDWNDTTDIMSAKNEAESANKSKSEFLSMVSHEIRTPLNAILGITQIELQKSNLPDDYASALEKISASGIVLLDIINDILDISKIETGKLEISPAEYCVPEFINDTVHINAVRIGSKPIEFILEASEYLPCTLFGDELRLKQVLNNLLSNAVKYTDKGYVKLSISHAKEGDDITLRFVVEDTGQGLTEDDQAKLFSPYRRFNFEANRTTEGVGLGLSIAKRLVIMMNGEIGVQSEYGKGSSFSVTVKQKPVGDAVIGAKVSEQLQSFTYSRKSGKMRVKRILMPYGSVLIVDDARTNLYVAKGMMTPYKLKIETAESGFAAIEKVMEGNTYDIIFMDHMMPKMDGIETTKRLRSMGYDGTIIALTANALTGNSEMFKQNNFDDYVPKPIDAQHLDDVLNKFIRDKHAEETVRYAEDEADEIAKPDLNPRIFEIFRRDAEKAAAKLRQTLESGDMKLFTTTVHGMKAALANIGEHEKSAYAYSIEKAALRGDLEFIIDNAEDFIEVLEELVKNLTPKEAANNDTGIAEDKAFLKEQLSEIITACKHYDDSAAYKALDLLKEKPWKNETMTMLEEIRDTLFLHSDFEEAAEKAYSLSD
ncbi:MAG: ATP-binding protein [Oscillospiraceae bacterium]|nr:ATP-binding protein [Oscillospiraceae bacterium]